MAQLTREGVVLIVNALAKRGISSTTVPQGGSYDEVIAWALGIMMDTLSPQAGVTLLADVIRKKTAGGVFSFQAAGGTPVWVVDDSTGVTTFQFPVSVTGALHPGTPAGATQAGAIYGGSGAPNNAQGNNGDFFFRTDTPGTANQRIYVRSAGAWVGIV